MRLSSLCRSRATSLVPYSRGRQLKRAPRHERSADGPCEQSAHSTRSQLAATSATFAPSGKNADRMACVSHLSANNAASGRRPHRRQQFAEHPYLRRRAVGGDLHGGDPSRCGASTARYRRNARRVDAGRTPGGADDRSGQRPSVHRLVGVHVFDVAAQHLPQCVAPVQRLLVLVDLVEGAGLPFGAVDVRGAAPFDDAEQPVTDR